jgi:hypothetical protein
MPYDKASLRIERVQADISYHAAYLYWNLRGLLAERWAHGPFFGAAGDTPEQTTLRPAKTEEEDDARLWGVYGLRGSGLNAEGQHWVPQAWQLIDRWIGDVLVALKPQRVVRASVTVVALYPVEDIVAASAALRAAYYNEQHLDELLPPSLNEYRQAFHSAVDFFVPTSDEGSAVSAIAGAVGPPHRGTLFLEPDEERDDQWWMGVKYERRRVQPDGLPDTSAALKKLVQRSKSDVEHIAARLMELIVE